MIPEHQLQKVKWPACKTMLKALGVRTKDIPKAVADMRIMLFQQQELNPEKFEQLYSAIVLGRVEPPAQQEVQGLTKEQVAEAVDELINNLAKRQKEVASAVANAAIDEVKEQLVSLVAQEAVKYRPIEIVKERVKKRLKATMPDEFERILQLASQRVNVMLVGPAGCGKTFLAEKVAEALTLPFGSISCSAGMSESQLTGWLLPIGASGKFEYVASDFVNKYENGGVFLFDEVDAMDPNVGTFINQAIANDGFNIPQRYKKPYCKKHKDFVCIAAANTYGNGADAVYVGRNQLDGATLDRFRAGMITMDYSAKVEQQIIRPDVYEWGIAIRKIINEHRMRRILSTRVMKDMSKMAEAYKWDQAEWDKAYFADWSVGELAKVEASLNRKVTLQ